MLNTEKITQELTIDQAIAPIVENRINFRQQRMLLHRMFTLSVSNAPDDETDNFTANQLTPFYLSLCETLENLDTIGDVHVSNVMSSMNNMISQ
jgi:hypothetical protein